MGPADLISQAQPGPVEVMILISLSLHNPVRLPITTYVHAATTAGNLTSTINKVTLLKVCPQTPDRAEVSGARQSLLG